MASVIVSVRPTRKENKNGKTVEYPADLRQDRRGTTMINAKDVDTNQFITFYPRKDKVGLFDESLIGKTVALQGTVHALGENVKMIVTSLEVVS
jgi:hypothetical protein